MLAVRHDTVSSPPLVASVSDKLYLFLMCATTVVHLLTHWPSLSIDAVYPRRHSYLLYAHVTGSQHLLWVG